MAKHSEDHQKTKKRISYKLVVSLIVILFLVLAAVIFLYLTYKNSTQDDSGAQQAKKAVQIAEKRYKEINEDQLDSKDYVGYQISLRDYAEGYSRAKDYKNAERLLKQILKEVPVENIDSETYYDLSQLYKNTDNQKEYKKYLQLSIEKMKAEGRTKDAAYYEKKLKEAK